MVSTDQIIIAAAVFLARVCDVALGTFRHAMVIRGKKTQAVGLAFAEALIWVYAVSKVLSGISSPLTALAFALGFAGGTWVGVMIEDFFKIGDQSVRIFSASGDQLAKALRERGYRVTVFEGKGRDGPVSELFIQDKRKKTNHIIKMARNIDSSCFLVIDDIRIASSAAFSVKK